MTQSKYDKKLIKWVKRHNWDSLEVSKHLILRHLRTFTGDHEEDKSCPLYTDYKKSCEALKQRNEELKKSNK